MWVTKPAEVLTPGTDCKGQPPLPRLLLLGHVHQRHSQRDQLAVHVRGPVVTQAAVQQCPRSAQGQALQEGSHKAPIEGAQVQQAAQHAAPDRRALLPPLQGGPTCSCWQGRCSGGLHPAAGRRARVGRGFDWCRHASCMEVPQTAGWAAPCCSPSQQLAHASQLQWMSTLPAASCFAPGPADATAPTAASAATLGNPPPFGQGQLAKASHAAQAGKQTG